MGYTPLQSPVYEQERLPVPYRTSWLLHGGLFILTFLSTVMAGTSWAMQDFTEMANWVYGLQYSVLIMTFLAAHEFGHYFAAKYHGVDATLPYFIPVPQLPGIFAFPFGTMGAVIRTRSAIMTRKALFDIGVAGPLAGFVVCFVFIIVGIMSISGQESLYAYHPEYRALNGFIPSHGLYFGNSMFYALLTSIIPSPGNFLPPMNEMYHYPFFCVGWFGLFVTCLNLLPAGQLDGGHIVYAMFGDTQWKISRWVWRGLMLLGMGWLLGLLHSQVLYDSPDALYTFFQTLLLPPLSLINTLMPWYYQVWSGWLFWAVLLRFVFKLHHPPLDDIEPIGARRMVIGWIAMLIFIGSFSLTGIYYIPEGSVKVPRQQKQSQPRETVQAEKGRDKL